MIAGRQALFQDKVTYRVQLDQFKMQMGLPPDLPMVVDMSLAQPFYDVFKAVDEWQRDATRSLDQLPVIIAKIPELEDIDVEGRSVFGPYRNYRSTLKSFVPENEEGLEDTLQAAVRIAMEYRMDLMNARASALRCLAADPRHGQRAQGRASISPSPTMSTRRRTPPTRSRS